MRAGRIGDQAGDHCAVGVEFVYDSAEGFIGVCVGDEQGAADVLDIESREAGGEAGIGESADLLPLAIKYIDVAAVLIGGIDLSCAGRGVSRSPGR